MATRLYFVPRANLRARVDGLTFASFRDLMSMWLKAK